MLVMYVRKHYVSDFKIPQGITSEQIVENIENVLNKDTK